MSMCDGQPEPGSVFTRTGVKALYRDAPADFYPLTGWCQPCGLALTAQADGGWQHRTRSAFWAVRPAGHRWDWETYDLDAEGLVSARAEARSMSESDAHGIPWVVELTEAGTRTEWARYKAGQETDRRERSTR